MTSPDSGRLSTDSAAGNTGAPRRVFPKPQQIAILATAGWVAWRPAEVVPWTAPLVAGVALLLLLWSWRHTTPEAAASFWWALAGLSVLVVSGLAGLDPEAALSRVALLAAALALLWLASRRAPPDSWPAVLAAILSGLAVWAVLQATAGQEHAAALVAQMPEALRAAASERLASGRGFASQPLPSHLAVLLATALPLLAARLRRRWSAVPWAAAALLCVAGLVVTRSPVGVALALAACLALVWVRGGRTVLIVVLLLALALAAVVMARGDVLELEPVSLRIDNWRTALWAWSTSPAVGVGFGGFGQAAQSVPFAVGNRPRHAHCLPLEWLAELGPLGLVAVLFAAAALGRLVVKLWRLRPELAAAVAIVPVHNLIDFSLAGSGVALPWAVLVGWSIALVRRPAPPARAPLGRPVATLVAALALAVAVFHATSVTVLEAAAGRERPQERFDGALTAHRLAPWRTRPLELLAVSALATRDQALIEVADRELEGARWLRPHAASLADLRGRLALVQGHAPSAVVEAWSAQRFNPANPRYEQGLAALVERLRDGVAAAR